MRIICSVIIPVYNASKWIIDCINSIPENSQIEIIAINDGSTDNTLELLNRCNHLNLRIINQKNQGVSVARNIGIKNAIGSYIVFLDSDDKLIGTEFLKALSLISKDEQDLYLFESVVNYSNYIEDIFDNNRLKYVLSKFYKTSFLLDHNITFFDGMINGEDLLFNLLCFFKTDKICVMKHSFYLYFQNMESSTNQFNHKIIDNDILFHRYLKKILESNNYFEKVQYIYNYSILNGICVIAYRTALLKGYHDKFIKEICSVDEYFQILCDLKTYKHSFSKVNYLALKQIKNNKFKKAILLFKIKLIIKKILFKNKNKYVLF